MSDERRFPVQGNYRRPGMAGFEPQGTIPWPIAERAYAVYSSRYGMSQSLERLAERGGFGWGELDDLIGDPGWRAAFEEAP